MSPGPANLLAALVFAVLAGGCESGGPGWSDAPAVADPEPSGPDDLRTYKESYYAALGRTIEATLDREELLQACARARIVWLGDHHDDSGLHAAQRELLETLCARGLRPVLMLEAIGTEDERIVQTYLAGEIERATLRRIVHQRWPGSWFEARDLDAAHYLGLLEIAKTWKLEVRALEPTPRARLVDRDQMIAARIRAESERVKERPIVVHVGAAHLLGQGNLVGRVGLAGPILGARLSAPLANAARERGLVPGQLFRTETGVVLGLAGR